MTQTSIPTSSHAVELSRQMVEVEMDMEVKSEPESEDNMIDCSISVTSSVELCQPDYSQSDEEGLEEEPLIEIESMMVSQQLVKDDLEPNLLLFVKNNPEEADEVMNTICSSESFEKSLFSKNYKLSRIHSVTDASITKALRSVKRKQNNKIQLNNVSKEKADNIKKQMKIATKRPIKKKFPKINAAGFSSSSSSSDAGPTLTNRSLKTKEVLLEKEENDKCKGSKPKHHNSSQEIKQTHVLPEEVLSESLPNEQNLNDSELKDKTEKGTNFVKSKGKENTRCNIEDDDTADTVLSSDQCEPNVRKDGRSKKKIKPLKPSSYDCTVCGKRFREKSHLATHARAHNEVRNFRCNQCGVMFKTKTNLFFHMKTHEAPFTCTKCDKTFGLKKMFTRHMRVVHSGEGLFNCDICGRPFKSAQNLELHYTLHTGNKPFSCDKCCKTFVYKSTYRAHMKAHEADEQFACELCLAAGPVDKSELRRRCGHYSQARPWLCTVCGKAYPLKSTLKNHMKSHEAEKPFKCDECGKYFMKRKTYECHLKTHTGEKPQYMCDQCSQSYYSYESLKRHYMKHTSDRRFSCDLCSKAFWTKDAMKVHRRSHENVKTFQCTQCSKAFAHKHSLVAHLRSHAGETTHACDICCKTFLHKYHLTRHLRQHTSPLLPPPPLPLAPSLYMLPPHNHLDIPTLQIL
ncbi:oocyte zinc finger protein XlCOF6-like [Macrosteles quadrilineatus]|uniref:oocyte zinc finger protein XlCOF6-like n=1 Tax=Macrosteles quadrilineatus TaxID=74068 RepID=UPI0023E33213|nr:oocyte zinc finger protein XlCOF6-like [Macrosteles quadrilineatus]